MPRPCPHVGCRHANYLEVKRFRLPGEAFDRENVLLNRDGLEPGDVEATHSCSLDVADRGPHEQHEVAAILGVSVERIRQIERAYEESLRASSGPVLRGLYEAIVESTSPTAWYEGADAGPMHYAAAPTAEEREEREVDAWADRVCAALGGGAPLRAAWSIANHEPQNAAEGDVMANGSEKGERGPSLRARVVEALGGGPLSVTDLAARLGVDTGQVGVAARRAAAAGDAHPVGRGVAAVWHAGKAAAAVGVARAARRARATEPTAPAPPPPAVQGDLLRELLAASPERLAQIDRLLRFAAGGAP